MEIKTNIPQTGMTFTEASFIKEGSYRIMVNGMIQRFDGGFLFVTNESSNLLASKFKQGFKVVGTSIVPSLSLTFFFLVNPVSQESEIGFIYDVSETNIPDIDKYCIKLIESEVNVQYEVSQYHTFVNADCLKFSIDHPISSWVKLDDCNVRIYFNDFNNPLRYIDYKNFPKVTLANCPLIETNQLDCDKIQIFPTACYPEIIATDVISGGKNQAGVYQFSLAYSDVRANKITDYFYVSNPLPLFDKPITVATDYPVAKSIKLSISNLNTDFKYFNLVVIKTINNVTTPYLIDTFEINSSYFEYIYSGVDKNLSQDLSIDEILAKTPYYNKAKIIAESNGYLIHGKLEEDRILNLQPTVIDIPVYWQTVEMNVGDYANPIIAQNNVGYLGDENYAFGISYTKKNGKSTSIFPFVGRNATEFDLEEIPQTNPDVIFNSSCDTQIRNKRWEVYNTASYLGDVICVEPPSGNQNLVEITDDVDCISDQILMTGYNITNPSFWFYPPSTITYPPQNSQQVQDLVNWLNIPANQIYNLSTDPIKQAEIGLCDCDSLLINYPPDATATSINPNTDPTSDQSSIDIITEETTFTVNTYALVQSNPAIPDPQKYPYTPTPCKHYDNDDKNEEKGEAGWIEQKTNTDPTNATLVVQSGTARCPDIDTFGAFIAGTDSWYQFYCNNQDGAVGILLSTDRSSCNGHQNNADLEVYTVDQNGGLGVQVFPVNNTGNPIQVYPIYTAQGISLVLVGLTSGSGYLIKVKGNFPVPTTSLGTCCKARSFKLCVVTPPPATSISYTIPGIVKVNKTCEIKYLGVPQNTCLPQPDKYGTFAYWESQETYPCNEELWGSVAGKPIRHFKFPDNSVVKHFEEKGAVVNGLSVKLNKIYPKGIRVDVRDIKHSLNKAVTLGLISEEEKNQICGYRIYRSNRRGNESIVAKGLIYDIWEYKDNIYNTGNKIMFPNFPFNDNGVGNNGWNVFLKNKRIKSTNQLIDTNYVTHPFHGDKNNKYTFDAPNLQYNNPGLGTELKLELEMYGKSVGNFIELRNNTKYQYIGAGIISAAIGFSAVEAAFEALNTMTNATMTIPIQIFGSGTAFPLGLILALIGENIISPVRVYSHYAEWYDIIKKFAPYRNYASYYVGVGKYTSNTDVPLENIRRNILNTQYVKPGILNVKTSKGSMRFNNFKRDSSVFIELDKDSYFLKTKKTDTSRRQYPDCGISNGVTGDISSYYASMKNFLPSQYGQIDNIEWIDTGYNGRIDWNNPNQSSDCDTIFGGDTFLNSATKKRKMPIFMEDRVIPSSATQVSPVNQDIQLSLLPNIAYPRFWMDYPTSLDYTGTTQALFGDVAVQSISKVDYNFICASSDGQSWKDAGLGAAILGSFAGASFGVISLPIAVGIIVGKTKADLGNDLFLKGKYIHSFYGITSYICESNYNLDLRHGENIKEKDFYPNVGDINEWTQEFFVPMNEDNYYLYNTDYSKQNKENPNFILNNDYSREKQDCKVQHPNRVIYSLQDNDQNDVFDGNLIYLANNYFDFPKSGGSLQIIKGVENGKVLAIQENRATLFNSYIALQTNVATATVGSNTLFNQQSPAIFVQTDLGFGGTQTQAIVSTEFGTYWVDNKRGAIIEYAGNIKNIVKPEEEWWFKENLPFKILKDFPNFDVTNNYKYLGMSIVYDARFKRIIFTKRDVELKPEYRNNVTYDGMLFHYEDESFTPESTKFFNNKSWTISYSPLTKNFISFHTYTPNYYIPNQSYFSSGINYTLSNTFEEGLWYHNLTKQSFQIFYGKVHPFIFEFVSPSRLQDSQIESVRYLADFYRFTDGLSSTLMQSVTYNKALIYNQKQSSGLLELVVKEKNNRRQSILYPIQNQNSRSILVEYVQNGYQFNNFYNVAVNDKPLLIYPSNNPAFTEINPTSSDYSPKFLKQKLTSDYHVIRLINDEHTNYQIDHRVNLVQINNNNQ